MIKPVPIITRHAVSLLVLMGLIWAAQPVYGQIYNRRPDLNRRPERTEKSSKPQKSHRGGAIKPSTINLNAESEALSENAEKDASTSAADPSNNEELNKEGAAKTKAKEWDDDENRALAKLQVRHKAKIILGDNKRPPYKYYVQDEEQEGAQKAVKGKEGKEDESMAEEEEEPGEEEPAEDPGEDPGTE